MQRSRQQLLSKCNILLGFLLFKKIDMAILNSLVRDKTRCFCSSESLLSHTEFLEAVEERRTVSEVLGTEGLERGAFALRTQPAWEAPQAS